MSNRVRHHFFWVLSFAFGVIVITLGLVYAFSPSSGTAPVPYPGVSISIIGVAISIIADYQINRGSILHLELIVLFNVLMALSFLVFNIPLWREGYYMYMEPFRIKLYGPYFGLPSVYPNLLFWVFWLSIVVNVYYISKVRRSKETGSSEQNLSVG